MQESDPEAVPGARDGHPQVYTTCHGRNSHSREKCRSVRSLSLSPRVTLGPQRPCNAGMPAKPKEKRYCQKLCSGEVRVKNGKRRRILLFINTQQPHAGPEGYATHATDYDERTGESSGCQRSGGASCGASGDRVSGAKPRPEPARSAGPRRSAEDAASGSGERRPGVPGAACGPECETHLAAWISAPGRGGHSASLSRQGHPILAHRFNSGIQTLRVRASPGGMSRSGMADDSGLGSVWGTAYAERDAVAPLARCRLGSQPNCRSES
jgi:hypothetical protein